MLFKVDVHAGDRLWAILKPKEEKSKKKKIATNK